MDEVHPPSGACITVCPLGINQHTLFLKPGLQAFQEFFIADYFQHRPKGHDFNQQLCFHVLIIIDEAFICVFADFCGVLLIIGEMQHGALKGVAFVDNMQCQRLFVVRIPNQRIQVNVGS